MSIRDGSRWSPLRELLTYPAYVLAYRTVAAMHGHAPLSLPIVTRIVVAGFRPVRAGRRLHASTGACSRRSTRTTAAPASACMALGTFEWAILAPDRLHHRNRAARPGRGHHALAAVAVGACGAAVRSAGAVGEQARAAPSGSAQAVAAGLALLVEMLEGIDGAAGMLTEDPLRKFGAWLGITVYWAADMFALWASLRTFGIHLALGKLIIAYSTGYAATRRSLPLGGAGATEALMTYALYWVVSRWRRRWPP